MTLKRRLVFTIAAAPLLVVATLTGGCSGQATPNSPSPTPPPTAGPPTPEAPPPPPPPPAPTPPPAPSPPPAPAPPPAPPPPGPTPTIVRSARFQSANGYRTEGSAVIVSAGTVHTLELQDDFRTSNSGVLEVRLCRDTRCAGGDLNLGAIRAFGGRQTYALPDDGAAFRYVVIWCRAVNLAFGFGDLR